MRLTLTTLFSFSLIFLLCKATPETRAEASSLQALFDPSTPCQTYSDPFVKKAFTWMKRNKEYSHGSYSFAALERVLNVLIESGRICRISRDEITFLKGLNPLHTESTQYRGVYVPHLDRIYLLSDLTLGEFRYSLYHELIHAYQYRYRFETDFLRIQSELTDEDHTPSTPEVLQQLAFYYEAQANYYTLVLNRDSPWRGVGDSTLSSVSRFVESGSKLVLTVATVGIFKWLGDHQVEETLPQDDAYDELSFGASGTQFHLSELYVGSNLLFENMSTKGINFTFHRRYSEALRTAYFGPRSLLEEDQDIQQDIHKLLHDRFQEDQYTLEWERIFSKDTKTSFQEVLSESTYLFELGVSIPEEHTQTKDPFFLEKHALGGEGSRPEIDIIPFIFIQPQIEIPAP